MTVPSGPALTFVSEHASRNRRHPEETQAFVAAARALGPVLLAHGPESWEALTLAVARSRPRVVIVSGGDGTLSRVLEAARLAVGDEGLPPVLLDPQGTMNSVARNLQLGRDRRWLLEAARGSAACDEDARPTVRQGDHLGFLLFYGAMAALMRTYEAGWSKQPWAAVAQIAKMSALGLAGGGRLQGIEPVPASLRLDGEALGWRQLGTAMIGTMAVGALGARLFPRMAHERHLMQVNLIDLPPRAQLAVLPRFWRGLPVERPGVAQAMVQRLEIESTRASWINVDGECYPADAGAVFELGPTVRFLVPRRTA